MTYSLSNFIVTYGNTIVCVVIEFTPVMIIGIIAEITVTTPIHGIPATIKVMHQNTTFLTKSNLSF